VLLAGVLLGAVLLAVLFWPGYCCSPCSGCRVADRRNREPSPARPRRIRARTRPSLIPTPVTRRRTLRSLPVCCSPTRLVLMDSCPSTHRVGGMNASASSLMHSVNRLCFDSQFEVRLPNSLPPSKRWQPMPSASPRRSPWRPVTPMLRVVLNPPEWTLSCVPRQTPLPHGVTRTAEFPGIVQATPPVTPGRVRSVCRGRPWDG